MRYVFLTTLLILALASVVRADCNCPCGPACPCPPPCQCYPSFIAPAPVVIAPQPSFMSFWFSPRISVPRLDVIVVKPRYFSPQPHHHHR